MVVKKKKEVKLKKKIKKSKPNTSKKKSKHKLTKKKVIKKPKRIIKKKNKVLSKKKITKKSVKKVKHKKPLKKTKKKKSKSTLEGISNIISRKSKILPRAKTGITNFDKMIEKGFVGDSINLIVGGTGSGKTIFALQFLLEGLKNNENVLYVTFEEKKNEFYSNMKKFGWDLEKLEKSGKFIFLEYSPEKVKMMLDEGGGSIETTIFKSKIKRMVIDSITSFSSLFDDEFSKRQAILGLFDIIRKWDCTTLFTVQDNPTEKNSREISAIEFESDGIILLYYVNINNSRKRFVQVLKMRGTNHSKDIHSFVIEKKGIKVGSKARIKKGLLKG